MPHTLVQYTAAEVQQILTAHARAFVGDTGTNSVEVEFIHTALPPESQRVTFTKAQVSIPQVKPGPRTVLDRGDCDPVPPRRT